MRRRSRGGGPGSLPGHVDSHKAGAAGGEGEGLDHDLPPLLVQRHQLVVHVLLTTHGSKSTSPFEFSSIAFLPLFSAGSHPNHLGQMNSSVAMKNIKWPQILNKQCSFEIYCYCLFEARYPVGNFTEGQRQQARWVYFELRVHCNHHHHSLSSTSSELEGRTKPFAGTFPPTWLSFS